MRSPIFTLAALACALAIALIGNAVIQNDYLFSASYTVLQFVVLASAWNILGGFTGYVNFGAAAFFALGAYSAIVLHTLFQPPAPDFNVGGWARFLLSMGSIDLSSRRR